MRHKLHALTLMLLAALFAPTAATAQSNDANDNSNDPCAPLYQGSASQAVKTLQAKVQDGGKPEDRFALGLAQTFAAFEHLTQSLNRYGLDPKVLIAARMFGVPAASLDNPAEDRIDAAKFTAMIDRFNHDLADAQNTLEALKPDGDLKVVLDVARVRLDYDGDGKAGPDEGLSRLTRQLTRQLQGRRFSPRSQPSTTTDKDTSFPVALDAGDVYWLRGYCHLLMGVTDFVLAHDTDNLFNHAAQLFFANPDTPYAFLTNRNNRGNHAYFDREQFSDAIAMIHLIHLKVKDPQRMRSALDNLKQVSAMSRQSWQAIQAETDNDREWIPSSKQQSVLGDTLEVDPAKITAWLAFLDQYEAVLSGKKLLPFWRGGEQEKRGVNLAKAFETPRTFDLVLWVQGSAAKPYLQQGDRVDTQFMQQFNRAFRGGFLGFAAIVN